MLKIDYFDPVHHLGLVIVLCSVACSTRAGDVVVRAIPGTEQVAIEVFSVSVSPDEKWVAFTEWSLPKDRVFKELPRDEYELRIATLSLENGDIMRHALSSIPAEALGFSPDDTGWLGQAGLEIIQQRFRPAGWRRDRFYFQPYFRGTYIALNPDNPGLEVFAKPEGPGACSDCPPFVKVDFRDRSWDLLSRDVSAVVRAGVVRAVYYVSSPYQHNQAHHRAIYRITGAGSENVIVEAPGRTRTHVIIGAVRASPNDRYLAYVVESKKQAFLAGPKNELFIRELASGREKRIAKYGYMGNLIWSPDGERLYFAGGEYASDSAVRVVDVAATFSK